MKERKPLSLYVHIPFCVKKCLYCDFLSGPASPEEQENYVELLCQEILCWGQQLGEEYELATVFLGGGTPSCLPPALMDQLGQTMADCFHWSEQLEFTTEANPGTVTQELVAVWRQMGINRISLGLQSAQEEELKKLGRIHDYSQFLNTYELLWERQFDNINVDLMTNIPGQTMESLEDTLDKLTALQPQHISAYSLILEPGTPFHEMEEKGLLESGGEELDRQMYLYTKAYLGQQGYERYEISNYAKPGRECRHNCVYWQGGEYLGVGLGAASYLQGCRFSNRNTFREYGQYVRSMAEKRHWKEFAFQELQSLDTKMKMEEFCFLGLRMRRGISRREFQKRFQCSLDQIYHHVLPGLLEGGLLAEEEFHDRIYLTDRGIDVSNRVLAEFLLD